MQRRLFYFLFPILLLLVIGFILTVYRLPLMNVSVSHEIVVNSTPPPTPAPIETRTPSGSTLLISSPSPISSKTPISSPPTRLSKARPTSKSTGAILNITSTAYGVAIQRYLSSLGDIRLPSSLRLPSRWDGAMLTQEDRYFLRTLTSMERYQLRKHMAPGNFEAILARTHHFTTLVSHLITSIPQLIILGAGYDTRCYQLHEWSIASSSSPTCYEIDLPTTQGIKRERVEQLQKSLLQHPNHPLANVTLQAIEHTHYIPFNMATCFDPTVLKHVASHDVVDVMCPTLTEALQQAGYDKKKKSIILVEGVVGYLSERCFSSLLDYLHIHTSPGSYLLFDFIPDSNNCYGMSHVHVAVNRLNEPIKFGMSPTRMGNFLELHNFNVIEQLTPADMEQRYLITNDGKSLGKVACFQHTITAINQ